MLTWGTLKPAISGAQNIVGKTLQGAGDILGVDDWVNNGKEIVASSKTWVEGKKPNIDLPSINFNKNKNKNNQGQPGSAGLHSPVYYTVEGKADFSTIQPPATGCHYTGKIDNLGRVGPAACTVTYEMVQKSKGHRQPFEPGSDPAGWGKNKKVQIEKADGKIYKGYMYNRSHLVADQLGGRAFYDNLVTGTRTQNVGDGNGGMRYTEAKATKFIENNKTCPVKYVAIPKYTGNEIIPRYVEVNVQSCNGEIDEKVNVWNEVKGYTINYLTGDFLPNK